MRIGYARVSKGENVKLQADALELAGAWERGARYADLGLSGATLKRPDLEKALERLGEGDTLVVWKFDRLARSLVDLLKILARIEAKRAHLHSLTENFDTKTPPGRMVVQILGAMAEYEWNIARERTLAGISAARARGVKLGRNVRLTPDAIGLWCAQIHAREKTIREAALGARVGLATMNRYLRAWRKRNGIATGEWARITPDYETEAPAAKASPRAKGGIAAKVSKGENGPGIGPPSRRTPRWRPGKRKAKKPRAPRAKTLRKLKPSPKPSRPITTRRKRRS